MKLLSIALLRFLVLALPLLGGVCRGQQSLWDSLVGASGSGSSEVVAIRAPQDGGVSQPVFTAVNFKGSIQLLGLTLLDGLTTPGGAVLRYSDDANGRRTKVDWSATVRSVGGVKITGMTTAGASGEVLVCGVSEGMPVFGGIVLPLGLKTPRGFVARLNPATGKWLGHFITEGILPTSVAFGDGQVFVTGSGSLCVAYSTTGVSRWKANLPAGWAAASHIDLGPGGVHVLAKSTAASGMLKVGRLSPASGATLLSIDVEGSGASVAAGLRVGSDGAIWVAGNHQQGTGAERGFLTRLGVDGRVVWKSGLGTAGGAASMVVGSFDLDADGNAWVGAKLHGSWTFPDLEAQTFAQDLALMAVDRAGTMFDFQRGTGEGNAKATAVCAGLPGLALLGGSSSGGLLSLGNLLSLNSGNNDSMFLSSLRKTLGIKHWVFRNDPNSPRLLDLSVLRKLLRALGILLYVDVDNGPLGSAVTGYATAEQVALLRLLGGVIAEPEIELEPKTAAGDWALSRMVDITDTAGYVPVETSRGVRLYLIDTAVKHVSNWFSANENLSIDGMMLVRGAGDPTVSSKFDHGTRMLSLIAGPETGVATRTPIRMMNLDIYPNGKSTSGLLASAILEAVDHHLSQNSSEPAAICLASSSTVPADSTIVRMALQTAVDAGIVVIVSAGNEGKLASTYLPARYGTMEGVICVGASGESNERTSFSNHGPAVDIYAPGDGVRALRYADPKSGAYDLIDGSSASAAYTSAAALLELSLDPGLSPGELEGAMKSRAHAGPVKLLQLAHPVAETDPEVALPEDHDGDGDGIPDIIERFHGSSVADARSRPAAITLRPGGQGVAASFTVAADLFVSSRPFELADGTRWRVMVSEDLENWREAAGDLTATAGASGTVDVRFTFARKGERGFVKIEVTPPGRP